MKLGQFIAELTELQRIVGELATVSILDVGEVAYLKIQVGGALICWEGEYDNPEEKIEELEGKLEDCEEELADLKEAAKKAVEAIGDLEALV